MSFICPSCGWSGCSCQKKIASDGTVHCNNCISKYESTQKSSTIIKEEDGKIILTALVKDKPQKVN